MITGSLEMNKRGVVESVSAELILALTTADRDSPQNKQH